MTASRPAADLVFLGGRILTMDPARPTVEAIAIAGDRIVAVGDRDAVAEPDTPIHDLAGATLAPGFIDAHNHLSIAALMPRWRDLTGVTSTDEVLRAVVDQAHDEPEVPWIRVANWVGPEDAPVDARLLDELDLDRPVVVADSSLHAAVVNGRALEALGIGRTTPDPPGGEIGRAADGRPDGLLLERAWGDAHRRSLADHAKPDRWADHIAVRARQLLAEGITAVHDAACSPEAEAVYGSMAASGTLPLGVLVLPHPATLLSHDFGERLDGPPTGEGSEDLRVGPVKAFADGGIAIGLDVSLDGQPIRGGILMDDLDRTLVAAADRGWRLAVHAIGNVGVERSLDAFERIQRRHPEVEHRFRLEHALVTDPSQWRRLAELGCIGVVQPGFVEHVGIQSGGVHFDRHDWLAFAGLAAAGVTLAGSSDDPCAPVSPLWCAHKGVTRTTSSGIRLDPEQSVPFEEWLRAYTAGAAAAGGQEGERGSLAPGLRADLVVLRGPLDGDSTPTVVSTWVAGRQVVAGDG